MRFIDPTTGEDVPDADVGIHLYRRVRFEDDSLLGKCLAAQPDASWLVLNNVRTLDYSEATIWACAAAFGGDNLAEEKKRGSCGRLPQGWRRRWPPL
jgi:hypothetical protein